MFTFPKPEMTLNEDELTSCAEVKDVSSSSCPQVVSRQRYTSSALNVIMV